MMARNEPGGGVRARGVRRAAFSLAEMMIALVILGLGLLFIASAIPAGVEYTRQTVDLTSAESAAREALETLRGYVRTSTTLIRTGPAIGPARRDAFVRPRVNQAGFPVVLDGQAGAEPFLKVRPLIGMNIDLTPGASNRFVERADEVERLLREGSAFPALLTPLGIAADPAQQNLPGLNTDFLGSLSLNAQPALPSVARVFPLVTVDNGLRVGWGTGGLPGFFDDVFEARPVYDSLQNAGPGDSVLGSETRKAADSRVVWTALYRRVQYQLSGPDLLVGTADDRAGNPSLYEMIVVVCRRPSTTHRFPRQDMDVAFSTPRALQADPNGTDRLIPEPWLVELRVPPPNTYAPSVTWVNGAPDRAITSTTVPPVQRFFLQNASGVTPADGLLPVGSVLIPAVNNVNYNPFDAVSATELFGFIPHSPDGLPIYTVVERPDASTVLVSNESEMYPWYAGPSVGGAWRFLFWVIPPAFTERDGNGQPVFERVSPVLTVRRQVVRVPVISGP